MADTKILKKGFGASYVGVFGFDRKPIYIKSAKYGRVNIVEFVTDFEYIYNEDKEDECTITITTDDASMLYDWYFIPKKNIYVQWGWYEKDSNGKNKVFHSPPRTLLVMDYTVEFSSSAIVITIKAYPRGVLAKFSPPSPLRIYENTIEWLKDYTGGALGGFKIVDYKLVTLPEKLEGYAAIAENVGMDEGLSQRMINQYLSMITGDPREIVLNVVPKFEAEEKVYSPTGDDDNKTVKKGVVVLSRDEYNSLPQYKKDYFKRIFLNITESFTKTFWGSQAYTDKWTQLFGLREVLPDGPWNMSARDNDTILYNKPSSKGVIGKYTYANGSGELLSVSIENKFSNVTETVGSSDVDDDNNVSVGATEVFVPPATGTTEPPIIPVKDLPGSGNKELEEVIDHMSKRGVIYPPNVKGSYSEINHYGQYAQRGFKLSDIPPYTGPRLSPKSTEEVSPRVSYEDMIRIHELNYVANAGVAKKDIAAENRRANESEKRLQLANSLRNLVSLADIPIYLDEYFDLEGYDIQFDEIQKWCTELFRRFSNVSTPQEMYNNLTKLMDFPKLTVPRTVEYQLFFYVPVVKELINNETNEKLYTIDNINDALLRMTAVHPFDKRYETFTEFNRVSYTGQGEEVSINTFDKLEPRADAIEAVLKKMGYTVIDKAPFDLKNNKVDGSFLGVEFDKFLENITKDKWPISPVYIYTIRDTFEAAVPFMSILRSKYLPEGLKNMIHDIKSSIMGGAELTGSVIGNPLMESAMNVYIENISRFSGNWYITKANHKVSTSSGYTTEFTCKKKDLTFYSHTVKSSVNLEKLIEKFKEIEKIWADRLATGKEGKNPGDLIVTKLHRTLDEQRIYGSDSLETNWRFVYNSVTGDLDMSSLDGSTGAEFVGEREGSYNQINYGTGIQTQDITLPGSDYNSSGYLFQQQNK